MKEYLINRVKVSFIHTVKKAQVMNNKRLVVNQNILNLNEATEELHSYLRNCLSGFVDNYDEIFQFLQIDNDKIAERHLNSIVVSLFP